MAFDPHLTRPRVLAILPGFFPSTLLTVVKPFIALHHARHIVADIILESSVLTKHIEWADVIVFSRNLEPLYGHLLDMATALRKPIIYDIDDNLFELPEDYQPELAAQKRAWRIQLERYVQAASLVRVYASAMQERVRQLNPRVVRVDGPVDWSLVPVSPPPREAHRVKIVYATSRWVRDDLASLFLEAIKRLLTRYPDHVELFCWGYHPPQFDRHPSVHFLDFEHDYDTFFRRFARSGFDIGLAPLHDTTFYRSKSDNKFREYAACRIAGVYSDVEVYSSCVENSRTGLLVANTPDAWFHALSRLVEEPSLRQTIQQHAFQSAQDRYSLEKMQAEWQRQIEQLLSVQTSRRQLAALGQANSAIFHRLHRFHRDTQPDRPKRLRPCSVQLMWPLRGFSRFGQRGRQLLHSLRHEETQATRQKIQKSVYDVRALARIKWELSCSYRLWRGVQRRWGRR